MMPENECAFVYVHDKKSPLHEVLKRMQGPKTAHYNLKKKEEKREAWSANRCSLIIMAGDRRVGETPDVEIV